MARKLNRRPDRDAAKLVLFAAGAAGALAGLTIWALLTFALPHLRESPIDTAVAARAAHSDVTSPTVSAKPDDPVSDDAGEPATTDAQGTDTAEPPADAEDLASQDGRLFCFIEEFRNTDGTLTLKVSSARMLTGSEAATAARAAGEESPPPNDYFISTDDPQIIELTVDPDARVTLSTTRTGTQPEGYEVTVQEWYAMVVGETPDMEVVRDLPYWLTVVEGAATKIEEQYLP